MYTGTQGLAMWSFFREHLNEGDYIRVEFFKGNDNNPHSWKIYIGSNSLGHYCSLVHMEQALIDYLVGRKQIKEKRGY